MGNTAQVLLDDLSQLRSAHETPDPLPKDAKPADANAHALHCDALAHLDNAIDALKRSLAGAR